MAMCEPLQVIQEIEPESNDDNIEVSTVESCIDGHSGKMKNSSCEVNCLHDCRREATQEIDGKSTLEIVTSTVNRLLHLLVAYNLLLILWEAHFWHFTDPKNLDFMIWPVLVVMAALAGPGLLLVFPKISKLRVNNSFGKILFLLNPIFLLLCSLDVLTSKPSKFFYDLRLQFLLF